MSHTFTVDIYNDIYVNFSIFDNDDMKSSKRHAVFLPLIFLLECISKFDFYQNDSNGNEIQKRGNPCSVNISHSIPC